MPRDSSEVTRPLMAIFHEHRWRDRYGSRRDPEKSQIFGRKLAVRGLFLSKPLCLPGEGAGGLNRADAHPCEQPQPLPLHVSSAIV